MKSFFLLFAAALLIWSCSSSSDKPAENPSPEAAAQNAPALPSLPYETVQYLWENCDYVDYVFYQLPISMSMSDQNSIRYSISHIAQDAATLNPNCPAIGRIFFQEKGENILEADIHFGEGCRYFVFLKEGKPAYANLITDVGVQYLNERITQAMQVRRQLEQQQQGGQ
ncbi:MAG: hypothetical protein D6765_11430 [Bacteroidetes bacterium]|nr:MAG: hypothetical protein D6765_11430 [Bacteroidota bacterium]